MGKMTVRADVKEVKESSRNVGGMQPIQAEHRHQNQDSLTELE
jgi:hypothetical protein